VPRDQAGTIFHTLERRHLARTFEEPTPFPRFQYDNAWDSSDPSARFAVEEATVILAPIVNGAPPSAG
jgi:hypothetical protein